MAFRLKSSLFRIVQWLYQIFEIKFWPDVESTPNSKETILATLCMYLWMEFSWVSGSSLPKFPYKAIEREWLK